ncbi:MAG: ATP-dependent DNA helicase DinG [Pseudomonadales bacterium]|jgi:ATP-dependent DNA helicase DinG
MLNDSDKSTIQKAYSRYLKANELGPRQGQKEMIAHIARAMGAVEIDDESGERISGGLAVIEAGTGTGKTIAYLIPTIPLAKRHDKKLIVSTATVALQEQILHKDLPAVLRHSGLSFSFELAKGRGRYLCPVQLQAQLSNADPSQGSLGLYPDEADGLPTKDQRELFEELKASFDARRWEGDRDSWPDSIEDQNWRRVTTDHNRCTGRRCEQFNACPFYQARESLETADVIVANHDLVLADLRLGGGAILSRPEESIYVFDEGHHLPEKALDHFAATCRLNASIKWLASLEKQLPPVLDLAQKLSLGLAAVGELPRAVADTIRVQQEFEPVMNDLIEIPVNDRNDLPRYRFPQGQVPDVLRNEAERNRDTYKRLNSWLGRFRDALQDGIELAVGDERGQLEAAIAGVGAAVSRGEENLALWEAWSDVDAADRLPHARWITWLNDGDPLLSCSPILASGTLQNKLWNRCFGAVVTSATLSSLGHFDRFKMRAGTAAEDTYAIVQSPFDFANVAELWIPPIAVDPSQSAAFDHLIETDLPKLVDDDVATLVLFTARRHMEQYVEALSSEQLEETLYQGQYSRSRVLELHKARIDEGKRSCLLGLASFAEGLDLPGKYCERVVIVKLPFSVPDAPVEAQLSEWIESEGGNSFMQVSVPDASLKLVQACGRLIRTETDTGQVVLLDKRVITKRYGHQLLNSLPPYRRRIEV